MPEFDREGGSLRVWNLIEFLREAGWAVSFVADDPAHGERYARVLRQRGVSVYGGFDARTDELIACGGFDIALIAFWHLAERYIPRVRRLSPSTHIVVDMIDLHLLRTSRQALSPRVDGTSSELGIPQGSEFVRELNTYACADGVLAVSRKEAELVCDLTGDRDLGHWVPQAESLERSSVPREERRGILFLGNFRHKPNLSAVEYLCRDIVPRLDERLVAEHPISIVGNDLGDEVLAHTRGLAHVRAVGWVPSVIPYLEHARVSTIPLLYGAGTKRKLIQALMTGTPTVSTSIGTEGFDLRHGREVLVADEPEAFALALEKLLVDDGLWERLARNGRERILLENGREATRDLFLEVLERVLQRTPRPGPAEELVAERRARMAEAEYRLLKERITEVATEALPDGASVAVVSKGDPELLRLNGSAALHFPQNEKGEYLGYHPEDSAALITQLEDLRANDVAFLLFPATAFWWLDQYRSFALHLDDRYRRVWADGSCIVYDLQEPPAATSNGGAPEPAAVEPLRPEILPGANHATRRRRRATFSVLALGVYLANRANHIDDIVGVLADSSACRVTQRWLALGGASPTARVSEVTAREVVEPTPKYELLNGLLSEEEDLERHDYVLTLDDDILLPHGFFDAFIPLQAKLDFAIAQPARTSDSYTDHPIVEQQRGVLARQTLFVEIGPVVSFHRSVYDVVFPFELENPMGWGYENVWSHRLRESGLKMGIIDAVPVAHSLRKSVEHYSWHKANAERSAYLGSRPHLPYEECFRVLDIVGLGS
jgi:glycosyltransferase involved in cell wall biosynthesis